MSPKPPRRPRYAPIAMGRTAEAAWEASLSVVAGAGIGYLADRWAGTAPWLMVVFVVLGTAAAFRRLLVLAKAADREPPKGPPRGNGASPQ
ncbi:MAG TPA: AtpZ/AtpI family protein [Myxococcota bacterium]|nr:AtpZ/AtpI family protein [Myxococcota bacterium]